jgi:hypothetical protein
VAVHVRNTESNSKQVTTTACPSSSRKRSAAEPQWGKNVSFTKVLPCSGESLLAKQEQMKYDQSDRTPYELFRLYYDDEVQNLIVAESVKYARQNNNTSFALDKSDLDVFIGIMLLTGCHSLPRERM